MKFGTRFKTRTRKFVLSGRGSAPRRSLVGVLRAAGVRAADVRRRHAIGELRGVYAAEFVAWRPASDAPASGIPGLGSIADSNVGPCKCGHTLFADRYGGQGADHWRRGTRKEYVGDVPREVLSPEGAARETPIESLGLSFSTNLFILLVRAVSLNLTGCCSAAHAGPKPLIGTVSPNGKLHRAESQKRRRQGRKP